MEWTARCACGQLSAIVEGEPDFVAACSCQQCRRHTGSVVSISAYFPASLGEGDPREATAVHP